MQLFALNDAVPCDLNRFYRLDWFLPRSPGVSHVPAENVFHPPSEIQCSEDFSNEASTDQSSSVDAISFGR
jgi:hypothetical protein